MNFESRRSAVRARRWHAGYLAALAVTAIVVGAQIGRHRSIDAAEPAGASSVGRSLPDNPLDADRAFGYLERVCSIGPRPSGSQGMTQQQGLLKEHFTSLGGKTDEQRFRTRHPLDGSAVTMTNLIVTWHPQRTERVLLCCHYDTRPRPDNEPDPRKRRNGRFIGANDGGSGVALLMELGHQMPALQSNFGIDFVFFDGEELVYGDGRREPERGRYFLGSQWFARQYKNSPPAHTYRWGILLDMVGDADLQIHQERHSVRWKDTRPLVQQIWATAARLGVDEFVPRPKYEVRDDHLPLRNVARIPTCDIIDFEFPARPHNRFWHTEADRPDKCSGESLAKVGWVVLEWLKTVK
jgi:hypothetical protein